MGLHNSKQRRLANNVNHINRRLSTAISNEMESRCELKENNDIRLWHSTQKKIKNEASINARTVAELEKPDPG